MNIRDEIVARRIKRIENLGHEMGAGVPETRQVPLVSFARQPFLICEMKRRSPSKGDIAAGADPVTQAGNYRAAGAQSISILTEEEYFGGSLNDLMAVKKAYPETAILRKDFLVDVEDIDVSFRAGADAVLLIASMLEKQLFGTMLSRVRELGMAALVELHSQEDAEKVSSFKPKLVGINSRDLETFKLDPVIPFKTKRFITWPCEVVFESGIFCLEDAVTALSSGFKGILVGESVMRQPGLVGELLSAFDYTGSDFWGRLYSRYNNRPLVKICGITRREDALKAIELGADIVGFILAESPRKTTLEFIKSCADLPVLKAGVVVSGPDAEIDPEIKELLESGALDVIQFHGDEAPDACFVRAFPYYKTVRIQGAEEIETLKEFHCPRVLIDAFSQSVRGGTGKEIPKELVEEARKIRPLWLAGGIGPENIALIVENFSPELVDVSSRLESEPGIKDHRKMEKFFRKL
ncbi:MAG: bifunctional indole-3-glycerol phosphate synthase/phosphoribosylanthranilate isomerase [Spirochaetales bacterium]|nr:bifunctional indole-3-glycerol phosphate synthase/phosphoribosylanthranilate isomerase [Spirochaetales bacterium]